MQRENAKHAFHTSLRQNPLLRGYYRIIHTQDKILYTTLKKPLISDKQMHWLFPLLRTLCSCQSENNYFCANQVDSANCTIAKQRDNPDGITFVALLKEVTFFLRVLFVSNFIVDIFLSVDIFFFLRRKKSVMDCVMKVFEMEPNESYLLETCLRHCPSGRTPTRLFTRRGRNSNEKEASSDGVPTC